MTPVDEPTPHPSRLALEQWAFAPEGGPRDPTVAGHVEHCAACTTTVQTWQQERAAFLTRQPMAPFLDAVVRGAPVPLTPRRVSRPWVGGALAVAASLLAFGGWNVMNHHRGLEPHLKGATGLGLELLVSRDGAVATPAPQGATLREGDLLRFAVTVPGDGYVFIADVEAGGRFTRFFPQGQATSAPVRRGARVVLPGSIALDSAQGEERVVLLYSAAPLDEVRVEQALHAAWSRAGLDGLEQADLPGELTSVRVRKGSR